MKRMRWNGGGSAKQFADAWQAAAKRPVDFLIRCAERFHLSHQLDRSAGIVVEPDILASCCAPLDFLL